MAINFDRLPGNKPYRVTPTGTYLALIEEATMKKGKDPKKPEYLNLKLKLKTKDGKSAGIVFDIIAESESHLVQYKLKRFLQAIDVKFEGDFELKDVQKVCKNKELIVDIKTEKGTDGNERATVDLFRGDAYYNLKDANEVFGTPVEATINAEDAEDAKSVEDILDEF